MSEDGRLSEEEAALVFRRAAELEATAEVAGDGGGFDTATLERIGVEAGLSPESVRRAVAELRQGRLTGGAATPATTTAPVALARRAVLERFVPVDAAIASERFERFLRGQAMRICRRRGATTTWEQSKSLGANLMRGVDLGDRMRLSYVLGVEVTVEPRPGGTFIRVEVDLTKVHRDARAWRITAGALGGLGIAGGLAGAIAGAPEALLLAPTASAAAAGTYLGTRSTYAKHARRAVDAVELVLDELEHGVVQPVTARWSKRPR